MSEWWTYTLSDFLLFSARTYHRLFELYNRDIWPLQLVALASGVAILSCARHGGPAMGKVVAAILAACWLWVAWAFHVERYATINWAANYFAVGFAIEALLLIWVGIVRAGLSFAPSSGAVRRAGLCVFLFALLVQPLIPLMTGRSWLQTEVFGVAPDPTAVATLGILLMASPRPLWALMMIPVVWSAIDAATLWTLEDRQALLMPLVALFVVLLSVMKTRLLRPGQTGAQ